MPEPPSREPTFVLGPLTLVALLGLWRGLTRRKPLAVAIGVVAAAAEFGWSDYRRFKRRWTLISHYRDS